MKIPENIVLDPQVMEGRPCVRGTRVTVGLIVGMLAGGHKREEVLKLYPYLTKEDIDAALSYAVHESLSAGGAADA